VPAKRAEFAHPDVAIAFTALSYYYSGLSDAQLTQAFHKLQQLPGAARMYEQWVAADSTTDSSSSSTTTACGNTAALLPPQLRVLSGVNLEDYAQRTQQLFPALRYNTEVIAFWLSSVVLPQESKQFSAKLSATAWDLVQHALAASAALMIHSRCCRWASQRGRCSSCGALTAVLWQRCCSLRTAATQRCIQAAQGHSCCSYWHQHLVLLAILLLLLLLMAIELPQCC
jgi:hypothetical protein